MFLITCCYLPFLESNPHMPPLFALLYLPSHCMPCLQGRLFSLLLLWFCSFSQPLPSLRYWARLQLFVGGQNNYIETLIETQDSCLMSWIAQTSAVLCICLSLSHKEEEDVITLGQNFVTRSPSIPAHWLKEAQCNKHVLQSISYLLRRQKLAGFGGQHLRLSFSCTSVPRVERQ